MPAGHHVLLRVDRQSRVSHVLATHLHTGFRWLPVLQMLVDIVGVVVDVKPLGSVKRKTDQMELSRRDITVLDQRWGSCTGCNELSTSRPLPAFEFACLGTCSCRWLQTQPTQHSLTSAHSLQPQDCGGHVMGQHC